MSKVSYDEVVDMRLDDQYEEFLDAIRVHFNNAIANGRPLFKTNVENLFDVFLNNLPPDARQHYTCNACRSFVRRYGDLITISEDGEMNSVLWGRVPTFFQPSVDAMREAVMNSRVTNVFLSKDKVLGQPITGIWKHMSVELPRERLLRSRIKTPNQQMCEKREDYKLLINGLKEYPVEAVNQAIGLLDSESLYRSEKCLGVAEWLQKVHMKTSSVSNNKIKNNILWFNVATAPTGFCHIRSTMIGTLLDDIVGGLSFDVVSRRFKDKMNPTQYQRPQAKPSSGNVEQAEKLIEELGLKDSLHRRFARLDEIQTLWRPSESTQRKETSGSVFGHLKTKDSVDIPAMNLPTKTMTWDKFNRTVLPNAKSIEYMVKSKDNFSALVTATYDDAPPIIRWDKEDNRNPFTWYVYSGGSYATDWNISSGWNKVNAVTYQPNMWSKDTKYDSRAVLFILDGAKDTKKIKENTGIALFPSCVISELREVRSTIESYSNSTTMDGYDEASACGLRLQYAMSWDAVFRVKTDTGVFMYKLDRWD